MTTPHDSAGAYTKETETMDEKEVLDDKKIYIKRMIDNDIDGCVAIEEKYGLFGLSPEMVIIELQQLATTQASTRTPRGSANAKTRVTVMLSTPRWHLQSTYTFY